MPNSKAIKILEELWCYSKTKYTDVEIREAINLAIIALKELKEGD